MLLEAKRFLREYRDLEQVQFTQEMKQLSDEALRATYRGKERLLRRLESVGPLLIAASVLGMAYSIYAGVRVVPEAIAVAFIFSAGFLLRAQRIAEIQISITRSESRKRQYQPWAMG